MMQTKENYTKRHFWATTIWLLIPAMVLCYLIFNMEPSNIGLTSYAALQKTMIIGVSMLASAIFYSFRFRLLPTIIILLTILYLGFKSIELFSSGEFQSYRLSILFIRISFFGIIGWLIGYLLSRFKFGSSILAIISIAYLIPEFSKHDAWYKFNDSNTILTTVATLYAPIIILLIYLIAASHVLFNLKNRNLFYWQSLHKRIILLIGSLILLIGGIWFFFNANVLNTIEGIADNSQFGENSLLVKKNTQNDGGKQTGEQPKDLEDKEQNGEGLTMNELLKMGGSNAKSNILLFAAYIDNFIPESNAPNPLYLSMYYYTLFDPATETFLIDSLATPGNDIFKPNIAALPLYFSEKDSSVLNFSKNNLYQKVVEIELYKKNVDISVFTAPTTAFEVQPIAIEKDYAKEFRTAYKAKSIVSTLNSAYFIYNIDNPIVLAFQEQRFEVLRQHNDYSKIDSSFLKYYTQFPTGKNYDSIKMLANQLAADQNTTIDKILAIKNHFLSRNEQGKRNFSYSDNPGIPELPSASRLNYFLFENKKGYCAYYAGATLYMLRALNIPSRIVGGFLTEDRASENNKGWYWYYADQAHAWVQVYFPELGWIDFDTTIDNEDARESPQADGTPPMQPPKPTLVIDGKFSTLDTIKKSGSFQLSRYMLKDSVVILKDAVTLNLDLSKSTLRIDTAVLPISKIDISDSITGLRFTQLPENIIATLKGDNKEVLAIDEIHTRKINSVVPNDKETKGSKFWNQKTLKYGLATLIICVIILGIGWSYFKWLYLKWKANKKNQSDTALLNNQFKALHYYLKKMQLLHTPNMLALSDNLDKNFNTKLNRFIEIYQTNKYNIDHKFTEADRKFVASVINDNTATIKKQISKKKRILNFLIK